MSDLTNDLASDVSGLSQADWFDRLDVLGVQHGSFERLGADHSALFLDEGRTLLVTFETIEQARRSVNGLPRGTSFVREQGWSLLSLISDGDTWFRDARVWRMFDRLIDDGFFEDFSQVLFTGAGPCGYAAAAFSVCAPGSRVLALRPQATLDPTVAGWDRRYVPERRRDFTSRFGYAPAMSEAAERAYVVYDPGQSYDAMHAALFGAPNATLLRCNFGGRRIEVSFDQMGITTPLILAAMDGTLAPVSFARLWRARRDSPPYLRGMLKRLEVEGRDGLTRHLCAFGIATRDPAPFAARLLALGQMQSAAAE